MINDVVGVVAITGHRPQKLFSCLPYSVDNFVMLVEFAKGVLISLQGLTSVGDIYPFKLSSIIEGQALGVDQAFGMAAKELGIPYEAARPFDGFDRIWTYPSQELANQVWTGASKQTTVCPVASKAAYQKRNEYMVDHSQLLLAIWDGTPGGTCNAIDYAKQKGRSIVNVYDSWIKVRRGI